MDMRFVDPHIILHLRLELAEQYIATLDCIFNPRCLEEEIVLLFCCPELKFRQHLQSSAAPNKHLTLREGPASAH